MMIVRAMAALAFILPSIVATAADYPAPKQGEWIARDFKFHAGEVMPELKLHYTTIGEPTGMPVVVLHGSGGSAGSMLTPTFAGELFGPGQPLDAAKYYIIIPDALGHGKSSKPSDGLKAKFPQYDYSDMVDAQYRLAVGRPWHPPCAANHRELHGWHARLALGREISQLYGCAGTNGLAADSDGEPQLDAAADDARDHP
jgi:hypothetical protein